MISKALKWSICTILLFLISLMVHKRSLGRYDLGSFPNLIQNGGFEIDKNDQKVLPGWNFQLSKLSDFKKSGYYWEEPGYVGKKSLGLTAGNVEPAVIWTEIKNLRPHAYYLLQFWAKRESFKEGVYLETELFQRKKRWDNHLLYGGWQKFFGLFNSQDSQDNGHLKFVNNFSQKFIIDEISLTEYKVLLYQPEFDQKRKTVRVSWLEPEHDLAISFRVQFSRHLPFLPAVTFEINNSGSLSLELTDMLARGHWFWRVEAFHGEERVAVSEIGQYEGDDFYPIGIYGVPKEELPDVLEAGFNIAQNYNSEPEFLRAFITKAESIGIKVMISPPDSEEALLEFKESPALFVWYLADEPEIRSISPKGLLQNKERLKKIDPAHPVAMVIVRAWASVDYALATDILMSDQYPVPHAPLTWLSDSMEEMRLASGGNKPIWSVIQAFMSEEEGWPREPTYSELRALTFLSIVHGAEGIFFFTYKGGSYYIRDSADTWNNLKKVVSQLNEIKQWLPLRPNTETTNLIITSPFQSDANGLPAIHYAISKKKDQILLIAVNVIDRPVSAKLVGLSASSYPLEVLFENRRVAVVDGILRDSFQPYETHIYYSKELTEK